MKSLTANKNYRRKKVRFIIDNKLTAELWNDIRVLLSAADTADAANLFLRHYRGIEAAPAAVLVERFVLQRGPASAAHHAYQVAIVGVVVEQHRVRAL